MCRKAGEFTIAESLRFSTLHFMFFLKKFIQPANIFEGVLFDLYKNIEKLHFLIDNSADD